MGDRASVNMIIWLLFLLLVVFNLLDTHQSNLLFSLGAYESNPLVDRMSGKFGFIPSVLVLKGFWLAALAVLIHLNNRR